MSYGNSTYTRTVDGLTQDDVCRLYERKVVLLARRLGARLNPGGPVGVEDLVSVGVMGLLDAFERFDPTLGIQFTTYAEYRIRGAMLDAVRESDTFSRRRRMLARRVERAGQELQHELKRPPTHEEMASRLSMDMDTYWDAMQRVVPDVAVAIDERPDDSDTVERALFSAGMATDGEGALRRLVQEDLRRILKEAIQEMPERTRHCIILYYARDFSLAEIAAVFDITVSRVSQILSDARTRLRRKLEPHVSQDDLGWMEAP